MAKSFLVSMRNLNETLLGSTCNFVRCIKPNAGMKVGVYNNRCVGNIDVWFGMRYQDEKSVSSKECQPPGELCRRHVPDFVRSSVIRPRALGFVK